jgi:hypothetical protein
MNIVSFGGGTNSSAMIFGMYEQKTPIDLILFADTGGEREHTYRHIDAMNIWLAEHGLPAITIVEKMDKDGNRLTLEDDCLKTGNLPAIAYGFKTCSLKHKVEPQDKFCNNYQTCIDTWAKGERVNKYIGYDAGEEHRKFNALLHKEDDKKFNKIFPLIDWQWYREDCENKILEHGLQLPGKSSCFFCPSMKKKEIKELYRNEPDLFQRAIAIEKNAMPNLTSVKGLGRSYSWKKYIDWEKDGGNKQVGMCPFYDDVDTPCDCYDGYTD